MARPAAFGNNTRGMTVTFSDASGGGTGEQLPCGRAGVSPLGADGAVFCGPFMEPLAENP